MMVINAQEMTAASKANALAHRWVAFVVRNVAMTHVIWKTDTVWLQTDALHMEAQDQAIHVR